MSWNSMIARGHRVLLGAALGTALALGSLGALDGTVVRQALAEEPFTLFMSEADEERVGREEHPKVLEEFGGNYQDPAINKYVASLGELLKSTTPHAKRRYTFTVLDSDVVNAFALPGGYVYISRGLMALANDEAELAGVVGHEIGHVVARHTAQRYSSGTVAGIGAMILGAITKSDLVGNLAQLGAAAYVQGFSRDQEFEADQLGIRYMTQAGFEPGAMASFLSSLSAEDKLAAKIAGREGVEPETSLFASHPRTADRVAAAAKAAAAKAGGPIARDREIYLKKIDGMIYGDSPKQGFVRGREFLHPVLKLAFEAPPGFMLRNSSSALIGRSKDGTSMLRFDGGKPGRGGGSMVDYVEREWAPNLDLGRAEPFTVNGMEAATANARLRTEDGPREIRLVAIRFDRNQIYRFMFVGAPDIPPNLDEAFREAVYSFRRLTNSEAAQLKPLRIKVVTVKRGDTVEGLAKRMAVSDLPLDTFLTLNGLAPGARLKPGSLVKIVVAGR